MDNSTESIRNEQCVCKTERGLYVPQRHLSIIIAIFILAAAGIFIAGYFYGKKELIEHISDLQEHEAFADQIYTAFFQDYANSSQTVDLSKSDNTSMAQTNQSSIDTQSQTKHNSEKIQYYAQLIGFGTLNAAQRFAKKLEKKGFSVCVNTRNSMTAQHKKIAWYQVVTKPYENRTELEHLVDRITKEEKLIGVNILIS